MTSQPPTVYDFASARPSKIALQQGSAVAVCRYMKRDLPNSFDLSAAERAQYLAWGLGVLYNAEQGSGDLITQPTSYFRDYANIVGTRLRSWGVSPTQAKPINVALSSDTVVTQANLATVINNYAAFAAALTPYGFGTIAYAQTSVIQLLVVEKISPPNAKHWLPGAIGWSMRPSGPNGTYTAADWAAYMAYPYAGMTQRLTASPVPGTDMNTPQTQLANSSLTAMGFDWPVGNPYAPLPPTPTPPEDDEMIQPIALHWKTINDDGTPSPQTWITHPAITPWAEHLMDGNLEAGAQANIKAGLYLDMPNPVNLSYLQSLPSYAEFLAAQATTVTVPPITIPPVNVTTTPVPFTLTLNGEATPTS